MATPPADIVVDGASISYRRAFRRRRVLSRISMTALAGEITAIVGPNGAGKTTLFRAVLGFLPVEAGRCLVGGLPPMEYRQRKGIAYQPETIDFPGLWNARDVLGCGVDLSGISKDDQRDAYRKAISRTRFDAATLLRPARRYSKGMKRRLSLAFALIGEPAVVLLDEPFAGLDPPARHALRAEITSARNRGATVVLASHELGEVERLANRAFILEDGTIRPGPALSPGDAPVDTILEAEFKGDGE
ncbi:MAG: ATP-binding cassette domain-containing protein [Gammaproteobacteria bacterium]|nr:ATP-binding cassette domain-containing protein [Gammaproteobacteria bacterium]MDE0650989.1 ATP-binding cassette domain-containing protein [Gammaproteobacteria bacterium]MYC52835.1 ATP-binding cassette domain-containing protein [Gammaproteobacteria bacterium]